MLGRESLHRAPKSTPNTSRTSPPEDFPTHTTPDPKTLCRPDQSTRRFSDPHDAGPEGPLPCPSTLDPFRPRCNPGIVSRRQLSVHKLQFLVHKFRSCRRCHRRSKTGPPRNMPRPRLNTTPRRLAGACRAAPRRPVACAATRDGQAHCVARVELLCWCHHA